MTVQETIATFIEHERLPASYAQTAEQYFAPLAQRIADQASDAMRPLLVGIHGCQGSGKSTLTDFLIHTLHHQHAITAVGMSIDDFYLPKTERLQLAQTQHPLLATRGVPGTHDIAWLNKVLSQFINEDYPIEFPRFNKSIDDRYPPEQHSCIDEPVQVVILEGWCVGSPAESEQALSTAVNRLEAEEDETGDWRHYANQQLSNGYAQAFTKLDHLIMLKAPGFHTVKQWRHEQEIRLKEKLTAQGLDVSQLMDEASIERFVQFYQRITSASLATLPAVCDDVFEIDETRTICKHYVGNKVAESAPFQARVYTDLDGTLLDHHDYSFDAALPALKRLKALAVPVIPVTSKTRAELTKLRRALNLTTPFIVENGAAVFIPETAGLVIDDPDVVTRDGFFVKAFSPDVAYWSALMSELTLNIGQCFTPFSRMTLANIVEHTGLTTEQASLAAQREYSDPIYWYGSEAEYRKFVDYCHALSIEVVRGGRFVHLLKGADKGKALLWLHEVYAANTNETLLSIALGDGENDLAMLAQVDIAVQIRSPNNEFPIFKAKDNQQRIQTEAFGPAGWSQAIHSILEDAL